MRLKSLVSAHFGLSLIVLAIFLRPASAGFRPSFSLEYSSWHATHIALVKITSKPGVFIVVESWKGELQPGDAIAVPELKPVPGAMPISLYPRSTDFFARDNSGTIEQIPAQPVGARMVVFLKNHGGRDSRPSSITNPREAWRSADLFNEMKASVVWIDGGLLYRFQQVVNPGPSMLIPWDISLHKMKHRVREIDHIRLELAKAVKSKDCGARAEALKEYVSSELYEAQQLALSELAKCGPATSKTNSPAKSQ